MEKRNPRHATLILGRAEIARLMTPRDYLTAVEAGFAALAEGHAEAPAPLHVAAEGGGFHAKGARLRTADGRDAVAVKVNGNFPGNPARHGLPTIQGAIVLSDARDGRVLALMDSIEVTLRRTAAATALAARFLARPDAHVLGVCGCGSQALAQVEAIGDVFRLHKILAFDADPAARQRLATQVRAALGIEAQAVDDIAAATRDSDIVVTCTTSDRPFLGRYLVGPGAFIAAVGADAPHKSEIDPALMARATVVVDSLDQCRAMGDLRHAIAAGAIAEDRAFASLADLVSGRGPGRRDAAEITLFDSTGLAVQDVAAALCVYDRARAASVGTSIALGDEVG